LNSGNWSHMVHPKVLISGLILFCSAVVFGQEQSYLAYFTDKQDTPFTIDKPTEYLTERSVLRRVKSGIPVTEEDLPVTPAYREALINNGVDVIFISKWLNAAVIHTTQDRLPEISGLPFIQHLELLGPAIEKSEPSLKSNVKDAIAYTEEVTALQNAMLGIDVMHEAGISGAGLLVAVLDGGFKGVDKSKWFEHLFEAGEGIIDTYDFVNRSTGVYHSDDHGTKVFSVLSAEVPGVYRSVLPEANYALYITEHSPVNFEYRIEEILWLLAAERADSLGADIIQSSLGYHLFSDDEMNYSYEEMNGNTALITRAAIMAFNKGMLVVTSAGNEGNRNWKHITAPADAEVSLAVGAVNAEQSRANFSSFGPTADLRIKPDVMALGVYTAVLDDEGSITFNNGTSFACPLISGLAGGLWQKYPYLSNADLLELIRNSGNREFPDNEYGYGIPTFLNAEIILDVEEEVEERTVVYPNPVNKGELFVQLSVAYRENSWVDLSFINHSGQSLLTRRINHRDMSRNLAIDITSFPSGTYILRLESGGQYENLKVVIL